MKGKLAKCIQGATAACAVAVAFMSSAACADALDDALALEGLERSDLGWSPRGYWTRYPADIPYKLRHFDALLDQPLATVTFARTAAAVVRDELSSTGLARRQKIADPGKFNAAPGPLYKAVSGIGVERKFGGLRAYSANITAPADASLVDAILAVHESAGRPTKFITFGSESPYPSYRKELEVQVKSVPKAAQAPIAQLILNLVNAHRWIELAFRNVPAQALLKVQRRLDLGIEIVDALDYAPEVDDVARSWDEASLWSGGLMAVEAVDEARQALASLGSVPAFALDWQTPFGWIRLRGGGNDVTAGDDAFLIVDLGGNDRYIGSVAASAPGLPISAVLDLSGNDVYAQVDRPSQGAGMGGVGILVDAAGDDKYEAVQCAQGFGQFGLGVLADLAGRDSYKSRYSSQGAGIFGVGVLLEGAGDDTYYVEADGQGYGASGGVGALADRYGNDSYQAPRDPAITGRPSYHSQLKVAVSNVQGVGVGRRGDGADGHSWAGGIGELIDSEGNDEYSAGNWSMGTGYWFGTGILHDGAGDDTYRGVWFSQGSGVHFCIGALIDEKGNDKHLVEEDGNGSIGFGGDFTVALMVDVEGNDVYDLPRDGLGFSNRRSVGMLLDLAGNDRYRGKEGNRPGTSQTDDRYGDYSGTTTYFAEASSLALFLDVGGEDVYERLKAANNSVWLDPEGSVNRSVRAFSIGVDRADGRVDLRAAPEKVPSLPRSAPRQ